MVTKEIERVLNNLGTVEDVSSEIIEEFKEEMPYSYLLYENKYNDVSDDSICIEVYSNGTFIVTNEDLPYNYSTRKEEKELKNLFNNTEFDVKNKNNAVISVSAKANNLNEVKNLIDLYRNLNDRFLIDKVVEVTGDDGKTYLDRIQ
jgi:hypothetical protein